VTTQPANPAKQTQERPDDAPEGDLPGLDEHNRQILRDRSSKVVDSILPQSPSDDELRGKR
jgi:hypothetical protein